MPFPNWGFFLFLICLYWDCFFLFIWTTWAISCFNLSCFLCLMGLSSTLNDFFQPLFRLPPTLKLNKDKPTYPQIKHSYVPCPKHNLLIAFLATRFWSLLLPIMSTMKCFQSYYHAKYHVLPWCVLWVKLKTFGPWTSIMKIQNNLKIH